MKFAEWGYSTIIISIIFLLILELINIFVFNNNKIIFIIVFLLAAEVLYFFRDPERSPDINKDTIIISPADGKVIEIMEGKDKIIGEYIKIGVFMNIFNVHVNRIPYDGEVIAKEYIKGKFLSAFNPKASLENERNIIYIKTKYGNIKVVQIAGLIARRIIDTLKIGDNVYKGQRFGMIKFGSKVDIYLPKYKVKILVEIDDKVYAGKTPIAEFKGE